MAFHVSRISFGFPIDHFDKAIMLTPIGHGQHLFDRHSHVIRQMFEEKPVNKTYQCPIQGCHQRFSLLPNHVQAKLAKKIQDAISQRLGKKTLDALLAIKDERPQVIGMWTHLQEQVAMTEPPLSADASLSGFSEHLPEKRPGENRVTRFYYFEDPADEDDAPDDHGLQVGEGSCIQGYYQNESEVENSTDDSQADGSVKSFDE